MTKPYSEEGGAGAAMQLWRQTVASSKRECQERRARVLAHPDLAARLKEPPLSLSDPARWNGYIPPRTLPDKANGSARANDSAVRRQLVDIASEALAREAAS